MSPMYRVLLACGRAFMAAGDPDECVARQVDRLVCDEATWLFVWRSLTTIERGRLVALGQRLSKGSLESRLAHATSNGRVGG